MRMAYRLICGPVELVDDRNVSEYCHISVEVKHERGQTKVAPPEPLHLGP